MGEPVELSLQNPSGRFGWLRLLPPHPSPLPEYVFSAKKILNFEIVQILNM
jgi:hypothetical protein